MASTTLQEVVDDAYRPQEYPALAWQQQAWGDSRPLQGVRVLDVTPVFTNTLTKCLCLLAAGAQLSVATSPLLPHDPDVVARLPQLGVPVVQDGDYDVVLDCAGVRATTPARAGYAELTRSGAHVYAHCPKPVLLVDDSRTKRIETTLGTGDGFTRALAHFGYADLTDRHVVVLGGGKVGTGAAASARAAGAAVTVVDPDPAVRTPEGCARAELTDDLLASAWCVVSATGCAGALTPLTAALRDSDAILANLGAEDEFGTRMPAARVLNDKLPVNFALPEPTRLRYLDATMALDNACAVALVTQPLRPGLQAPPRAVEDEILTITRAALSRELDAVDLT